MADFVPFTGELDQQFVPFTGEVDGAKPARPRTMTEEFKRQIGRTLRMGATGLTGTAGMLGDAVGGIANMALEGVEALGAPKTPKFARSSDVLQRKLTEAGLPEDETTMEKVTGFIGGAMSGGADPGLRAAQAATQAAFPAMSQQLQKDALTGVTKELSDAGYSLPPSHMQGTGPSLVLESLAGKSQVAQGLAEKNAPVTNALARKALRLPDGVDITPEVLKSNVKYWVDKGYKPLENAPDADIGGIFRNKMSDVLQKYAGNHSFADLLSRHRSGKQLDPVEKEVYDALFSDTGRYLRTYTMRDLLAKTQRLRMDATDNFANRNTRLAKTQREIAEALEDQVELSLKNNPHWGGKGLVDNFRQARAEIAKTHSVERMLVDKDTGVVSAAKAHGLLQKGVPLTDELRTIAQAGSPMFGPATRPPIQGAPSAQGNDMEWALRGALAGMMGGQAVGSPVAGATFGTIAGMVPAVRGGARHLIASPWYQGRLASNLGAGPGYLMTPPGQRSIASGALGLPLFTAGQQ